MKHIDYSFTDSDLKTCLFALTYLDMLHNDADDISHEQISINKQYAASACEKLTRANVETLTINEMRVVCACITFCNLICDGCISADANTVLKCMEYALSLEKLDKELCSLL